MVPLRWLDPCRDAGEDVVLPGVIGVQMAVDQAGHVLRTDLYAVQRVADPPRSHVVGGVQLRVAEAEPSVDQEDAAVVMYGEAHDDAAPIAPLWLRKPKRT